MKYAIIEDGVVVNVAVADEPLAENWIASESAAIGDLYDGEEFIRPPAPHAAAPASVTMRQARLALLGAGLLSGVDAAIDSLDEPHRSAARIEWEYAQAVERYSPLTEMLGSALGLTSEAMDALFFAAEGL